MRASETVGETTGTACTTLVLEGSLDCLQLCRNLAGLLTSLQYRWLSRMAICTTGSSSVSP